MTHTVSFEPDAPDGKCWLVLALANIENGPLGGPVWIPDSAHETYEDAKAAFDAQGKPA